MGRGKPAYSENCVKGSGKRREITNTAMRETTDRLRELPEDTDYKILLHHITEER